MKKQKRKGHIDRSETFDEFLAKDGILAETEDAAGDHRRSDQGGDGQAGPEQDRDGGADENQPAAVGSIARS